jgi:hypothetical protein
MEAVVIQIVALSQNVSRRKNTYQNNKFPNQVVSTAHCNLYPLVCYIHVWSVHKIHFLISVHFVHVLAVKELKDSVHLHPLQRVLQRTRMESYMGQVKRTTLPE